jgi:hypothetical protein
VLAVTGLVIVSVVVASAFFGNKFGMENIATVRCPVLFAKDVVVRNPSVDNNERPGIPELIFQGGVKDYRLGMFLSVFDGLKTLSDFSVWEDGSRLYPIVSVTGGVGEIQGLVLLENAYYNISAHISSGRLSSVNEFCRDQERLVESESQSSFLETESYPRTLVNPEISIGVHHALMSVLGYFLIGAPDRNGGESIDDKNNQSESLKPKRELIYPIALYVAGNIGMLGAWLNIGRCRKWWSGGLSWLGMVSGFCIAVLGGLIALDRIVGVF